MAKSKRANEALGAGALVVIPCKLSSKRLPLKNVQEVDGVPLVTHALRVARGALPLARVAVVDQEHELTKTLSRNWLRLMGSTLVRPPLWLPKESSAVVALWALMASNFPAKYVVLLQPCTLRTPELVRAALARLIAAPATTAGVVSVSEVRHPVEKSSWYEATQYDGGVYAWRVDKLLSECFQPLCGNIEKMLHSSLVIDIDTELDLKVARAIWPEVAKAEEE